MTNQRSLEVVVRAPSSARRVSFAAVALVAVALVAAWAGCGSDERSSGNPPGSGKVSTAEGEGGAGGGDAACEVCTSETCGAQTEACLEDPACNCRVGCDDDPACTAACPTSELHEGLLRCVVEATIGPCVTPCDAACEACSFDACPSERDACLDDPTCVCGLLCEQDTACLAACGDGATLDPLLTCFGETGADACAATCGG